MVQNKKQPAEEQSNRKKAITLMIAALFCLFGIGMFLYARSNSVDAVEAKLKAIGEDKNLSREERWEKQRELRRDLPDDTRRQLEKKRDVARDKWLSNVAAEYYKKSPQERKKALHDSVQREQERLKEIEARMAARANGGAPGGGNGQANAGGGPGGPRGFFGFGRGGTPEERQQARDARLDNLTPEERAQMHNYRYERNQQRQAMGLPLTGGPRGGFGGGPPRGIGGPPR
jgi:hypothetical protein